jgi:hypothetical protein
MQKEKNYAAIISSVALLGVILLLVGSFTWMLPAPVEVPTAEEIASKVVVQEVEVPTAEEIASLIEVPVKDTILSVMDEKKELSEDLATEYLDNKEVKKLIAESINDENCGDIVYKDITEISVRDVEVSLVGTKNAIVTFKLKVFFDNFGEDDEPEDARVDVKIRVTNLDRDDNYEDAEVDENYNSLGFEDGLKIDKAAYSCSLN